jgi:hypothetical protein
VFEHVIRVSVGRQRPIVPLSVVAIANAVACLFHETVVERQIMTNAVLPALRMSRVILYV